jgi:hypothetical protein
MQLELHSGEYQPKSGSYAGNLRADFSAGNGADAVVAGQCRFRRKGNPNTDYVISSICVDLLVWVGTFVNFSELSEEVSKAEIVTENHI